MNLYAKRGDAIDPFFFLDSVFFVRVLYSFPSVKNYVFVVLFCAQFIVLGFPLVLSARLTPFPGVQPSVPTLPNVAYVRRFISAAASDIGSQHDLTRVLGLAATPRRPQHIWRTISY
eukprot:GEMP01053740.1.p2 GENE.GEMP01053740.1~~GEMP01053740.1.p2  ORF type:complete len:117 (+),score=15.32 GEMP01053740.1:365-715(+)